MAAGLNPPFHDRVHAGYPDAAEHDTDSSVGEYLVEQGRVFAVPVPDQVSDLTAGVLEVRAGPKLADVARAAEVSTGTASNVLNLRSVSRRTIR